MNGKLGVLLATSRHRAIYRGGHRGGYSVDKLFLFDWKSGVLLMVGLFLAPVSCLYRSHKYVFRRQNRLTTGRLIGVSHSSLTALSSSPT